MPESYLRRSLNTELAVRAPRPALRGRSHLVAAFVAWPVGTFAILAADPGVERIAVASFALGAAIMFSCSALLHLKRWDALVHERLLRLDHSGIYCTIGGTTAAIALLGLDGRLQQALLVAAGVGSGVGIVLEWLPFAPPRGLSNTVYISLGWLPILVLPWLWMGSGAVVVLLIIAGGVLYTSGAIIVALRRPDVLPGWFGYHELFHVLVIVAVLLHARAVWLLIAAA
jgi:hemolysin III